ncbi:MAG: hypothetical protein QGG63_02250 [Candidatus Pacebacteria bacterium]|jgi:hypothetical protein|nr:hypothetical protein [Candidatus Paceibacterota bacterium]|tara:strand:- start:170 stop:589 length:420 start_codon:yes stop_codon:yes gene_type:complete
MSDDIEKKKFYKALFHLDKEPVIRTQCCNDDPTQLKSCEGLRLAGAQKSLDNGIPVVLENFGRRIEDGDYVTSFGTFFLTDMIVIYVPGEKIDREFFKKYQEMNKEHLFDATPYEKKLSKEEKERRNKKVVKDMAGALD